MLHVVGWHERIGWHQMCGKCIVGVAFIFTSKISSKMKLNVRNSRVMCFQRFSIPTSEKKIIKFCQNPFFFQCVAKNIERWLKIYKRSSPIFYFLFFWKFEGLPQKTNIAYKDRKGKILRKSTNFANFRVPFFWDLSIVDNESYLVTRT